MCYSTVVYLVYAIMDSRSTSKIDSTCLVEPAADVCNLNMVYNCCTETLLTRLSPI